MGDSGSTMTKGRKQRINEARIWYPAQNFTSDSHIVKAYRKHFNVDKNCAMRELVMLGMLPKEKQKAYKQELASKNRKRAQKNQIIPDSYQDDDFFFIAGYTSGSAPYAVIWEEVGENGLLDE